MLALTAGVATTASAQRPIPIFATNKNAGVKAILVQNVNAPSGWSCTQVPSDGKSTTLASVLAGSTFQVGGFSTTDCRLGTALKTLNQPIFTVGNGYQVFIDVNGTIQVTQ
ncbi:hypothetical protein [Xanthomonas vasicola]|uniref:hypothetical protein n=1 Tax=Xanthomonas vasicola TaxID=56459 RepID=UPI0001CBF60E|nr:hypothetical protein [Xanthomonas vasicola]KFA39593.1 hypothetical protein KWS_0102290 [Xanthomonas vasicola pv. musacearum NCPPB 4384]AZR29750.1 hypothetical protein KWO_003505 [Xanthomonas vasicola pv. musacearum NCPPB 4379]AZR33672.1 hypothetical protein NX08_003385 [Xanthomonas vasicola]KGR48362.1 hypothetical protein NX07_20905 [Xanthomonas vasicola]MBV6744224.1 hypothetical protein [Xanthomonas vasicola pv. musacearum NCPPB 2251]